MGLRLWVSVLIAVAIVNSSARKVRRPRQSSNFGPEADINPNVNEHVISNSVNNLAQDISINLWNQHFTDNVLYSPLSIGSLMGLILLGTRGVSFEQLKKALFFPENVTDSVIHESFQYVLGSLETGDGVNVNISTRLFVQEGIPIEGTYRQIAQALYDANVVYLNFKRDSAGSIRAINHWVEESTSGKIRNLIRNPFDPQTSFVAVNTILFNGPWEFPFSAKSTTNDLFDTGKVNITIPMMTNVVKVMFLEKSKYGFDMISLPYKGKRLSLYIMTPRGKAGVFSLVNMESRLSSLPIPVIINEMKETLVSIKIPKMKMQFRDNFREYFEGVGATAIFNSEKANLGRMTTEINISIQDVVHEAVLEITETGTIAAAATSSTADRFRPAYFVFNKPSIIFIRDNTNGLILFWGRVVEPELVS